MGEAPILEGVRGRTASAGDVGEYFDGGREASGRGQDEILRVREA
ncbi:hypothetical protein [Methylobacterium sp. W2]|nr:hypothetical protein [Methylobacterium sp. W2]